MRFPMRRSATTSRPSASETGGATERRRNGLDEPHCFEAPADDAGLESGQVAEDVGQLRHGPKLTIRNRKRRRDECPGPLHAVAAHDVAGRDGREAPRGSRGRNDRHPRRADHGRSDRASRCSSSPRTRGRGPCARFWRSPSSGRRPAVRRGGSGVLDLAIVGAGVSGISAAIEAKKAGLAFRVFEATETFSTVVNFPRAKPIYTYPVGMTPAGGLQFRSEVHPKEALLADMEKERRQAGIEVTPARIERIERRGDRLVLHHGRAAARHPLRRRGA